MVSVGVRKLKDPKEMPRRHDQTEASFEAVMLHTAPQWLPYYFTTKLLELLNLSVSTEIFVAPL